MPALVLECLQCGCLRDVRSLERSRDAGLCPRCFYVGWAVSGDLSEDERRELRDHPVEARRRERPAGLVTVG
jgi:hypothetical protein